MFMQKFRIDLKIRGLNFKISIKHSANANPKSMIATVPLIEGNVRICMPLKVNIVTSLCCVAKFFACVLGDSAGQL